MVAGGGIGMAVLALVVYLLGGDPSVITDSQPARPQEQPSAAGGPVDPKVDFVKVVLADTEDTWDAVFKQRFQRSYEPPRLVLFTGAVESACGFAQAAVGPFYCPRDHNVYIDLAFYEQLKERFRAPGDFAQAYVIAHEVGHHVQSLLGVSDQVTERRQRSDAATANALSVRTELQADCFAGLWARNAHNQLDPGDIEEALTAATAIGDDTLQKRSQGYVVPESFTHGSAQQRVAWFRRGFEAGTLEACDTFKG
jgi:uncharacterized protein